MSLTRTVVGIGIEVAHGFIDPALVAEMQEELFAFLPEQERRQLFGQASPYSPPAFRSRDLTERWNTPAFDAGRRVTDILGIQVGYPDDHKAVVNYHPAFKGSEFHQDDLTVLGQATVIHCGPNGAFDHARNASNRSEAEKSFETVELNAGDVLWHTMPHIYHRGRNRGDTPRATLALARYSFKPAVRLYPDRTS